MDRKQVFEAIRKEREYQDEVWGGSSHDAGHSINDWAAFMTMYIGKMVASSDPRLVLQTEEVKSSLVKVAALAAAALENLPCLEGDDG